MPNDVLGSYLDPKTLLDQKRQAMMQGIDASEYDMYRIIGLQQQQMEDNIRKRRMQAMKSGASSAQLAAQEMQALLAAQQGAQTAARDIAGKRLTAEDELANYALQAAGLDMQRYAADSQVYAPILQADKIKAGLANGTITADDLSLMDALAGNKKFSDVAASGSGTKDWYAAAWDNGLLNGVGASATNFWAWLAGNSDSDLINSMRAKYAGDDKASLEYRKKALGY